MARLNCVAAIPSIRAEKLDYGVVDDKVKAAGSVHINQGGNVYEGTALDLQVDAFLRASLITPTIGFWPMAAMW